MIRDLAIRGALVTALAAVAAVATGLAAGGSPGALTAVVLLATGAGLGAAAGYVTFRNAEDAVRAIGQASERLGEGELWERVSVSSRSTADLVRHFNHMASRMQELVGTNEAGQARLEAVFNAVSDAMIAVAADTSVRFLNDAALRVFGVTRDGAEGRPFIESARDYELDALIRRVIAHPSTPEAVAITFGQSRAPLRAVAVPIREGGDWAVLLMLNDLTEIQRLDQVRRDFLSNVSHELRTPLASIRALVETMDGGTAGQDETHEFLTRILQQAERMTALVNELLDLSRIESGAIELRPEPVRLAELAHEAASLLWARCERAGIKIAIEDAPGVEIEADRAALLRVMTNLLDNAIKFSPDGRTIHVGFASEGALVAMEVRDEGPGIPPQDLARVFERFYKGEASRANAGTGLGLAIVKHLVRAHGGTVEAASPPASGAIFTVRLPRQFAGAHAIAGS